MPTETKTRLIHPVALGVLALFGVLLPAVTLAIELATHMCAEVFFDPIPTVWHAVLVGTVPVVNAVGLWALFRPRECNLRWLWLANGLVFGLALFYTLLYLPLTPLAVVAIAIFGWGLLPLAPLLGLVVAWIQRVLLRKHLPPAAIHTPGWWALFALGFLLFGLFALPQTFTRVLTRMAAAEDPATATRGVHLLRVFGHNETLLRDCYGAAQRSKFSPFEIVPAVRSVEVNKARELYYRVTGRVFSSVEPPQRRYGTEVWDEFDWDDAVGGEAVAGLVRGVSLRESRLDAVCVPDQAWGYLEWILEFENVSQLQREARAQLMLPPGAVVSRVTLWINGEEREAAFGGRGQTRRAYQEVAVAQRRDPLLVTTSGPDRVLVQCFPIPPNGRMKIRLGISSPLLLSQADQAVLQWPYLLERNFKLPADLRHSTWLKADGKDIRTELSDAALSTATVSLPRNSAAPPSVVQNGVTQTILPVSNSLPSHVVCVVDASATMAPHAAALAEALTELASQTQLSVLLANDQLADPTVSPAQLRTTKFRGGHDNLPALVRACDQALNKPGTAILWIHGPQPVLLSSVERLVQILERTEPGKPPVIFDLPLVPGPNLVTERLAGVRTVPNAARLRDRIRHCAGTALVAQRHKTGAVEPATGAQHVVRLWAKEETERLIAERQAEAARTLAVAHHLVTPVSGAVVLETAEQYKRHELNPADPASTPAVGVVPEPTTALLVGLGLVVVMFGMRRQRACGARCR